jgi:hypothetical protein
VALTRLQDLTVYAVTQFPHELPPDTGLLDVSSPDKAFSKAAGPEPFLHPEICRLVSALRSRCPHQQHQWRAADECNGCGQFAFVAPAVSARQAVRVDRQPQALNTPVCNLGKRKKSHLVKLSKWTPQTSHSSKLWVLRSYPPIPE